MISPFKTIQVKQEFMNRVAVEANKPAGGKAFVDGLGISYDTLRAFTQTGLVRFATLQMFVRKLDGPNANVNDYIENVNISKALNA